MTPLEAEVEEIGKDIQAIKKALLFILENERDAYINSSGISIRNMASEFEPIEKVKNRIDTSKENISKLYKPVLKGLRRKW